MASMSSAPVTPRPVNETEFEKRRGISRVEVRPGFAQIHVLRLEEPLMENRLRVLAGVGEAGISIDFLKLTQIGLSFVVPEEIASAVGESLTNLGVAFDLNQQRTILLVHAVNIRDEEGLIARIVLEAIASGAKIDHISDMHDRMLMIVGADDASKVQACIEEQLLGKV